MKGKMKSGPSSGGGKKTVRKGPISTPFKDAICSKPGKGK